MEEWIAILNKEARVGFDEMTFEQKCEGPERVSSWISEGQVLETEGIPTVKV